MLYLQWYDHSYIRRSLLLYGSVFAVNLLSMAQGMGLAFISPIYYKLQANDTSINLVDRPLGSEQISIFVGLLHIGAILGCFIAQAIADVIGRKNLFHLLAWIILAGFLLQATGNLYTLYLGRFLVGLGSGGGVVIFLYAAEISEIHNRASTATITSIMFAVGRLYAYCIGKTVSARLYCFLCAAPMALCIVLIVSIVPESPFYLVEKKQDTEALKVLYKLRPTEKVAEDIRDIKILTSAKKIQLKGILTDYVSRKALLICLWVRFLAIFSGVVIVVGFLGVILDFPNGHLSGDTYAIIVGGLKVISGCSTSLFVDNIGRRTLLITCLLITVVCHTITGIYFSLKYSNYKYIDDWEFVVVVSVAIYGLLQTLGLRMLAGLVLGEMLPNDAKPLAAPIVTAFGFAIGLVTSICFPLLEANSLLNHLFFAMSFTCLVGAAISYMYIPETKQKSLLEIQAILKENM
ncbi:unnamed protein product [Callosobruchus maculatus]|uniref:Major facilitator superfamily (MFS) profile domain-containing protein n=1 Tax=Callosobruchus maculatus TaxID=64391 RepID=A0A653CJ92_CALMS|nr:unnamed protein product [Callosobruchus maculatus]